MGNLQFVVGQDVEDENTFHLHEEFVNLQAFRDHCASPHFVRYDDYVKTNQPFTADPSIYFYYPMGEDRNGSSSPVKKQPIHKGAFGLNVNLYPKANVRETFLNVILNNKKGTDTLEELALQYTFGESTTLQDDGPDTRSSSSNIFHFHEQYSGDDHGKEGFDAHTRAPHFAAWEDFVATDPFEKDPEVYFFRILE
jgi:quinol monooxygenase YgiN